MMRACLNHREIAAMAGFQWKTGAGVVRVNFCSDCGRDWQKKWGPLPVGSTLILSGPFSETELQKFEKATTL